MIAGPAVVAVVGLDPWIDIFESASRYKRQVQTIIGLISGYIVSATLKCGCAMDLFRSRLIVWRSGRLVMLVER